MFFGIGLIFIDFSQYDLKDSQQCEPSNMEEKL